MNKAIVIFGQQRFVDKGIYSFRNNIVDFEEYDIFIHTWKDTTKDESIIYDLWKPKDIIIEEPQPFGSGSELVHRSMFYSTKRAFELLNASTKNYDAVIRTRFDVCIDTKIDVSEYDLSRSAIFAPDICSNPKVLSDFLMFGSGECMNSFLEMFDNYDHYRSTHTNVNSGEEIIWRSMRDNNYEQVKVKEKVYLIRDGRSKHAVYWADVNEDIITKHLPS